MKVLISGGGTAGHVYPAIALASALSTHPEAPEVVYAGTKSGIEANLARQAGFEFVAIRAKGVDRSVKGLSAALPLTLGTVQAMSLLGRMHPDVIVGMGGFVSAPVLAAARLHRIPYVLHEQNSVPGLVNRAFARRARVVGLTFAESEAFLEGTRTVVVGNPVRAQLHDLPSREQGAGRFGLDPAVPTLLVFGGSRGARNINEAAVDAHRLWADDARVQVLHVAGRVEFEATSTALKEGPSGADRPRHVVVPYIEDMAAAYACADLVLSRAGATTIAEVALLGLPSVLVPYPYATEDHQRRNAAALESAGACRTIDDSDLDGERLVAVTQGLLGRPEELAGMGEAARAWARPDAAQALAEQVMQAAGAA